MNALIGIGVDIVETVRIQRSVERHGSAFLDRIFTAQEQEYCEKMTKSEIHYAARFAAKEAVSKCFGTGFGEHLGWKDVEVLRRDNGEPWIELHGVGREYANEKGITKVLITLSHSDHYAVANAVALSGGE